MTVAELGERMSARELTWWEALFNVERAEAEEREEKAKQRPRRR